MKKTLAAITLAGSIALMGAVPAMAANNNYPAPPPNSAVSDGTVGPGEQFVFRGKGFRAGEGLVIIVTPGRPSAAGASVAGRGMTVTGKITLPLAPQSFSTKTDGSGAFSYPLTISETGVYTLTATGAESGVTSSSTITVQGAAVGTSLPNKANGAALANTGADSNLMIWSLVGAGALAAGVTSVVVVRRRAKADVTV
jgi:LPXTG-motif cell wall-anchored protein